MALSKNIISNTKIISSSGSISSGGSTGNNESIKLTINIVGQGSVDVDPSGPYNPGAEVTLTAIPASGWEFQGWSGALSGSANPTTLKMNKNKWVRATFAEKPSSGSLTVLRFESSHTLGSNMANPEFVAAITDMYFCWPWHSRVIDGMHSLNPSSKVIVYRDFQNIRSETSEFNLAIAKGWILLDEQGEYVYAQAYPQAKVADRGNPEYREYVANWVKEQIAVGFDGVFCDNAIQVYPKTAWGISARPINPRTDQLYTDQEWLEDCLGFINYIKSEVPEALLICNGMPFNGRSFYRDQTDLEYFLSNSDNEGIIMEGTFDNFGEIYSETDWKKSVDTIIWFQNNYLKDPNRYLVIWSQAKAISEEFTQDQMALFIYTSSLLGVSVDNQNYISLHGHMESEQTQDLFMIELGIPVEEYHIIEGTHIYERTFSKVKVLVNPTSETYTIELTNTYLDMNGDRIASITLSGYTGTILTQIS